MLRDAQLGVPTNRLSLHSRAQLVHHTSSTSRAALCHQFGDWKCRKEMMPRSCSEYAQGYGCQDEGVGRRREGIDRSEDRVRCAARLLVNDFRACRGGIRVYMVAILLLASAATVPAGQAFACTPTHVWDGDGPVWCAEGPRIRLAGIAAREMDGTCRSSQPCPAESAENARDALVELVGKRTGVGAQGHILVNGPTMQCVSTGSAGGDRTGAWCVSPRGGDLSCSMVATGTVLRWGRYWNDHRCR